MTVTVGPKAAEAAEAAEAAAAAFATAASAVALATAAAAAAAAADAATSATVFLASASAAANRASAFARCAARVLASAASALASARRTASFNSAMTVSCLCASNAFDALDAARTDSTRPSFESKARTWSSTLDRWRLAPSMLPSKARVREGAAKTEHSGPLWTSGPLDL